MHEHQSVILNRDCEAVLIPSGTPLLLPQGAEVIITQALGGSYTVNVNGNPARIGPMDADALGFAADQPPTIHHASTNGKADEESIWEQLRTCFDPEIPINIVDLGLIYHCGITPVPGGNKVDIVMTLTAPGCGMGQFLVEDVRSKVATVPGVTEVNVELTFDPPWNQDMMSEAARIETGLY